MLFTFVSGERDCEPTLSVSGSEAIAAEFVPGQTPWWLWEVALLVGSSGQLLRLRYLLRCTCRTSVASGQLEH